MKAYVEWRSKLISRIIQRWETSEMKYQLNNKMKRRKKTLSSANSFKVRKTTQRKKTLQILNENSNKKLNKFQEKKKFVSLAFACVLI